jgi:hypothetical protein
MVSRRKTSERPARQSYRRCERPSGLTVTARSARSRSVDQLDELSCRDEDHERGQCGELLDPPQDAELDERMGLAWAGVDPASGLISVERLWDQTEGSVEPKSAAGRRRVPIAAMLRDRLVRHGSTTQRRRASSVATAICREVLVYRAAVGTRVGN